MSGSLDQWAQWLLHRRYGGDPSVMKEWLDFLIPLRDRVLDGAALTGSETLLDVGCGDGLIAFGALERLPKGRVIFTDISTDLLGHCKTLTAQMGVADRCAFIQASADSLAPIVDESVDAVTLRSVIIYVKDKRACFESFHRVLKPGGLLSLFEPINSIGGVEPAHMLWGFDVSPIQPIAAKVRAVFDAIQPPGSDPMLDFDERDLLALAQAAGFQRIQLDYHAEVRTHPLSKDPADDEPSWRRFLNVVGNPRIPSMAEAVEQALMPDEADAFLTYMRSIYSTQVVRSYSANCYLTAAKASLN